MDPSDKKIIITEHEVSSVLRIKQSKIMGRKIAVSFKQPEPRGE